MRLVLRRHFFLLIGVFSLSLFYLIAGLDAAGRTGLAQSLAVPMRIVIVLICLVWMLIAMVQVALVGPHGLSQAFAVIMWPVSIIAGLAPYALVDYILDRLRGPRLRK